jgi:hypothetical protein
MPRVSKGELEARKEAARLEDERRRQMEAAIADLEKRGFSHEQISEEMGLMPMQLPPAWEFLTKRLWKVSTDQVDAVWHKALVDLLFSKIPLDRRARDQIGHTLWRLAFPNTERDRREKAKVERVMAESMREHLTSRGLSDGEADKRIGKMLKISDKAVQQRRTRQKRQP